MLFKILKEGFWVGIVLGYVVLMMLLDARVLCNPCFINKYDYLTIALVFLLLMPFAMFFSGLILRGAGLLGKFISKRDKIWIFPKDIAIAFGLVFFHFLLTMTVSMTCSGWGCLMILFLNPPMILLGSLAGESEGSGGNGLALFIFCYIIYSIIACLAVLIYRMKKNK